VGRGGPCTERQRAHARAQVYLELSDFLLFGQRFLALMNGTLAEPEME
jgi:hypothetical protein